MPRKRISGHRILYFGIKEISRLSTSLLQGEVSLASRCSIKFVLTQAKRRRGSFWGGAENRWEPDFSDMPRRKDQSFSPWPRRGRQSDRDVANKELEPVRNINTISCEELETERSTTSMILAFAFSGLLILRRPLQL